jgi:hypothetical protein
VGALCGRGNGAGVTAAPDAIADARDEAVAKVADGAGDETEEATEKKPLRWQLREKGSGGIGPETDLFSRRAGITHDDNGLRACRRVERNQAVTGEQIGDARRLGGDEAQAVVAIAAQKPAHGAIAEAAAAIVDDEQPRAQIGKIPHIVRMIANAARIQAGARTCEGDCSWRMVGNTEVSTRSLACPRYAVKSTVWSALSGFAQTTAGIQAYRVYMGDLDALSVRWEALC